MKYKSEAEFITKRLKPNCAIKRPDHLRHKDSDLGRMASSPSDIYIWYNGKGILMEAKFVKTKKPPTPESVFNMLEESQILGILSACAN